VALGIQRLTGLVRSHPCSVFDRARIPSLSAAGCYAELRLRIVECGMMLGGRHRVAALSPRHSVIDLGDEVALRSRACRSRSTLTASRRVGPTANPLRKAAR
jgi:hypothetical protein